MMMIRSNQVPLPVLDSHGQLSSIPCSVARRLTRSCLSCEFRSGRSDLQLQLSPTPSSGAASSQASGVARSYGLLTQCDLVIVSSSSILVPIRTLFRRWGSRPVPPGAD